MFTLAAEGTLLSGCPSTQDVRSPGLLLTSVLSAAGEGREAAAHGDQGNRTRRLGFLVSFPPTVKVAEVCAFQSLTMIPSSLSLRNPRPGRVGESS
jgi:hypothetical protein